MQVLSHAKVAHLFSFCLNKLLSRRPSLFFPSSESLSYSFHFKKIPSARQTPRRPFPFLTSVLSIYSLWIHFCRVLDVEPTLCQMWGTLREIWPKERQPFLEVLIFPGKNNQEHWRSCKNPIIHIIHWIINCGRTMAVKAKKSQHQWCQLSLLSNLQTYWVMLAASGFTHPHSIGMSEGPAHNPLTFSYSAMVQEIGLDSCPMSRGQFSLAHTLMTSGLCWPVHTEVLELKAQGLAIERRQRETTGEKMPGPDYRAWVHQSSEINSSLPPLAPQDQHVCLCIAGRQASSSFTQLFLAGP